MELRGRLISWKEDFIDQLNFENNKNTTDVLNVQHGFSWNNKSDEMYANMR